MANLENVIVTTETTDGLVRKLWLAGIGVYVKGFEEIQSQFEKINGEAVRLFEKLVSNGEKFTADTKDSVIENVQEETAVDKRVAEVRKQLGLDTSSTETKISELTQKVNELTQILNKLS